MVTGRGELPTQKEEKIRKRNKRTVWVPSAFSREIARFLRKIGNTSKVRPIDGTLHGTYPLSTVHRLDPAGYCSSYNEPTYQERKRNTKR